MARVISIHLVSRSLGGLISPLSSLDEGLECPSRRALSRSLAASSSVEAWCGEREGRNGISCASLSLPRSPTSPGAAPAAGRTARGGGTGGGGSSREATIAGAREVSASRRSLPNADVVGERGGEGRRPSSSMPRSAAPLVSPMSPLPEETSPSKRERWRGAGGGDSLDVESPPRRRTSLEVENSGFERDRGGEPAGSARPCPTAGSARSSSFRSARAAARVSRVSRVLEDIRGGSPKEWVGGSFAVGVLPVSRVPPWALGAGGASRRLRCSVRDSCRSPWSPAL